eukprot:gene17916-biopygen26877
MSEALFSIKTLRADDALWICQTDLLRCLDSEARGMWRLVCKSACKAVEDNTRCLTWKERGLNEEGTGRKASAQVGTMLPSMGMCLNPSAAAGMMLAFSSVAVVSNSLLLRARYGLGEVKEALPDFQALQQTVMAANGSMSYASVLQMYESYVADANAGGRGAGRHNPGHSRGGGQGRGRVGALLCTHCKNTTHLVDTCWTKYPHLRPARSPPANAGRGGGGGRGAPAGGGAPVSRVEFDALVSQLAGYSLESPCDACARGKAKRVSYHEPRRKTHSPLEIVHVDLMGPFSQGLRGEYYLLVMVDDYSNWQAVVAMVTKGDSAFWIVNTLKAWMALLVGVVLGCLRSDQAKEFCTAEVEDFLKSVKARHELSSVYCPQQNGNAERMNGVVAATARTMLLDNSHRIIESRDVDWYEGAGPRAGPAPVPGQDPFDGDFSLDGPETAVNGLGPEVVTSPTPSDSPVGTAAGSDSGFRISDFESGPGFHMQLRSRNQAPAVFPTFLARFQVEIPLNLCQKLQDSPAYISTSSDISYKQAMDQSNPHRDGWLLAMRDKMESLHAHGTWQLAKLPRGVVPIENRWCFSFKHGDNGVVVRQKARVVAKGFLHRAGLDYDLTFAPVTPKSTLRTLLAGMVHNRMFARPLDIKTAFLNGVLEEELYMEQPQGFVVRGGWVCKLIKSLYGLKQSPRKWCEEVRRVLRIAGFTPAQADPALFIRLEPDGTVSWVLTYVDDFWLALHCLILYAKIVAIMWKAKWTVTKMGVPKVFLSIDCDLTLDSAGRCVSIVISQHNQIFGMLERYPIALEDETKQSPHVPMISGAVTKHAAGSPALPNNLMYASLIGSLIYLSTCTRPDIAYSVSALSRFTSKLTQVHWRAAQRVLVYLRKYPNLGIRYSHSSDFAVHAYSDASFGDDPEGRRSQTGMAILASGGVVHWASKRQITPAVSTGEAEYQALAATARDVQWFKHLRVDLGLPCSLVTIQCDSTVANSWCAEVALVPRAKHIDIMHHYVRDLGMSGRIEIAKVDTTLQLADAFTKALEAEQFWFFEWSAANPTVGDAVSGRS